MAAVAPSFARDAGAVTVHTLVTGTVHLISMYADPIFTVTAATVGTVEALVRNVAHRCFERMEANGRARGNFQDFPGGIAGFHNFCLMLQISLTFGIYWIVGLNLSLFTSTVMVGLIMGQIMGWVASTILIKALEQ